MIIKIIILLIIFLIFMFYMLFLKEYFKVKKVYKHLRKVLDTRDTLVLKLIPEIKNKEIAEKVIYLIDERKENFKTSYNNSILSDIKLNTEIRKLYEYINTLNKNEVINNIFGKILNLEKELKNIRNKYNVAVENYNNNFIKHKNVCLKIIRMKPLDTYNVKK